jgi:hypothetical protein
MVGISYRHDFVVREGLICWKVSFLIFPFRAGKSQSLTIIQFLPAMKDCLLIGGNTFTLLNHRLELTNLPPRYKVLEFKDLAYQHLDFETTCAVDDEHDLKSQFGYL